MTTVTVNPAGPTPPTAGDLSSRVAVLAAILADQSLPGRDPAQRPLAAVSDRPHRQATPATDLGPGTPAPCVPVGAAAGFRAPLGLPSDESGAGACAWPTWKPLSPPCPSFSGSHR
jgi:hypothetical protein